MRKILLAGVALALSACGGGGTETNNAAVMTTDNMLMDENLMLDQNMMNGMAGMDANATIDANTANLMMEDATSNDADTNLANGL